MPWTKCDNSSTSHPQSLNSRRGCIMLANTSPGRWGISWTSSMPGLVVTQNNIKQPLLLCLLSIWMAIGQLNINHSKHLPTFSYQGVSQMKTLVIGGLVRTSISYHGYGWCQEVLTRIGICHWSQWKRKYMNVSIFSAKILYKFLIYLLVVCIEWAKARARAHWWGEVVLLTVEEMWWVITFYRWKACWWWEQANQQDGVSPCMHYGLAAYAEKQASVYIGLGHSLTKQWYPWLRIHNMLVDWPAEFIPPEG